MSNAFIKINFMDGTDIRDACEEACTISKRMGINVEFDFNGVTLWAYLHSKPNKLFAKFEKEIGSD